MLLDASDFPENTILEQLFSPVPEYPEESAGRSYYFAPDFILHQVTNWGSVAAAKRDFNLEVKSAFDVDKYRGPWETPPDLFISSSANNYRASCGEDDHIYQCRMVATYGAYSVFFRSWVSVQGITMAKVNELLQAIDTRMTECIR